MAAAAAGALFNKQYPNFFWFFFYKKEQWQPHPKILTPPPWPHVPITQAMTLEEKIFITTPSTFQATALEVFRFQAEHCAPYRQYIDLLGVNPNSVSCLEDIPFLPISLFRTHRIYTESVEPELVFSSSGTTGDQVSRHLVARAELYERSFLHNFRTFYGDPAEWSMFFLLPNYFERQGSSLVLMAERLRALSDLSGGGFYLYDFAGLQRDLQTAVQSGRRVMVMGVTFALVDFAEQFSLTLPPEAVVMETGGMKGRRQQIQRQELHQLLGQAFCAENIHSEYGMTELLSQAYSPGQGLFHTPSQMRVLPRKLNNPLAAEAFNRPAGLNIIDLANIYSCSFIATADMGIVTPKGSFTIQGRIEGEILRGCNMLTH